jgi:2'-5' RNA ligase
VRLFLAAWPPPEVADVLAALSRPDVAGVRWTPPARWHVTLRFLGDVDDPADAAAALAAAAGSQAGPPVAEAGPRTEVLGGAALVVPVRGLEAVAAAVERATAAIGRRPEARPFRGHLTLARAGRGPVAAGSLRGVAGAPVSTRWLVREATLVRSTLGRGGARYEVIATAALGGGDGAGEEAPAPPEGA